MGLRPISSHPSHKPSPMAHTETDNVMWADALMQSRRTVLPKRLVGPGPDAHQQG